MKRFIPVLAMATVLTAAAGTFYDKSVFYGDVSLGTWTAPTNFTAAVSYGGAYTNGTSFYYRIAGTNAAGRTPWASNNIAIAGGAESNAIALSWARRDGVTGYLIQRSAGGSVWTQHLTRSVSDTSYNDVHDTNWTAGAGSPTGAIAAAGVPWQTPAGVTSTVAALAYPLASGTTASGLAASAYAAAARSIQDNSGYGTNLSVYANLSVVVNTVTNGIGVLSVPGGYTGFLEPGAVATWNADSNRWEWSGDYVGCFLETREDGGNYVPYLYDVGNEQGWYSPSYQATTPIAEYSDLWIQMYAADAPVLYWDVTKSTTVIDRGVSAEQITGTSGSGTNYLAGSLRVDSGITTSGMVARGAATLPVYVGGNQAAISIFSATASNSTAFYCYPAVPPTYTNIYRIYYQATVLTNAVGMTRLAATNFCIRLRSGGSRWGDATLNPYPIILRVPADDVTNAATSRISSGELQWSGNFSSTNMSINAARAADYTNWPIIYSAFLQYNDPAGASVPATNVSLMVSFLVGE